MSATKEGLGPLTKGEVAALMTRAHDLIGADPAFVHPARGLVLMAIGRLADHPYFSQEAAQEAWRDAQSVWESWPKPMRPSDTVVASAKNYFVNLTNILYGVSANN